jgi:hypothetical protein
MGRRASSKPKPPPKSRKAKSHGGRLCASKSPLLLPGLASTIASHLQLSQVLQLSAASRFIAALQLELDVSSVWLNPHTVLALLNRHTLSKVAIGWPSTTMSWHNLKPEACTEMSQMLTALRSLTSLRMHVSGFARCAGVALTGSEALTEVILECAKPDANICRHTDTCRVGQNTCRECPTLQDISISNESFQFLCALPNLRSVGIPSSMTSFDISQLAATVTDVRVTDPSPTPRGHSPGDISMVPVLDSLKGSRLQSLTLGCFEPQKALAGLVSCPLPQLQHLAIHGSFNLGSGVYDSLNRSITEPSRSQRHAGLHSLLLKVSKFSYTSHT